MQGKIICIKEGLQILKDKSLLMGDSWVSDAGKVYHTLAHRHETKIPHHQTTCSEIRQTTRDRHRRIIYAFFLLNWIFPLHVKIEYSTIVTDSKGEVINAYLTSDQKWRMKTELDEISPLLRKTIIAKEDKYFYSHPGINAVAVTTSILQKYLPDEKNLRRQYHHNAGGKSPGTKKKEYRQQAD